LAFKHKQAAGLALTDHLLGYRQAIEILRKLELSSVDYFAARFLSDFQTVIIYAPAE
jgi:hypothetical protein